jgi:hypothetical protein
MQSGRGLKSQGGEHYAARLSEADIPLIRHLLAEKVEQKEIARRYGVSRSIVNAIATGRSWKHVP